MKTNKILSWSLLVLQLVYMIVLFFEGQLSLSVNCALFAIVIYLFINANKIIEEKNKIIDNMSDMCQTKLKLTKDIENEINIELCKYDWYIDDSAYWVYLYKTDDYWIPIKRFPFNDDKEYAKLCAEELIEMLNENN